MRSTLLLAIRRVGIAVSLVTTLAPESSGPRPLALRIECPGGDCSLLKGVPQTAGMRSGFVRLKPDETVGWHTTGKNEEALVILHGQGVALMEGLETQKLTAPALAYIPPGTRHNVSNTGNEPLEYVYVVTPAAAK